MEKQRVQLTVKTIPKFVVSLTTSPSRINHIRPTIESIVHQTYKPERIVINIPQKYKRTGETYTVPAWFADFKHVLSVHRCGEDLGPITKLVPTLALYGAHDDVSIVTVDDDIMYLPHMLEDLARAYVYRGMRDKAVGYSGFFFYCNLDENFSAHFPVLRESHVDVLEGYGMVAYRRSFFGDDFVPYVLRAIQNKEAFFSDDIIISNYLAAKDIKRVQVFTERNNRALIWSEGCVSRLGLGDDALHTGANGATSENNGTWPLAAS